MLRSQQRFKTEAHNVFTEEVNKTALTFNDDKRLHSFDKVKLYTYGISVGKLCEEDILKQRIKFRVS